MSAKRNWRYAAILVCALIGSYGLSRFGASRVARVAGNDPASVTAVPLTALSVAAALPRAVLQDREEGPVLASAIVNRRDVTVLLLLDTSCGTCTRELPLMDLMAATYAREAAFIGLVCAEEFASVDSVSLAAVHLERTLLCDHTFRKAWGVRALPTVVVVDKTGTVLWLSVGQFSAGELEAYLRQTRVSDVGIGH